MISSSPVQARGSPVLRDIVEERLQRRWYRRAAAMVPTTNT
jgi:hypothetical protein